MTAQTRRARVDLRREVQLLDQLGRLELVRGDRPRIGSDAGSYPRRGIA